MIQDISSIFNLVNLMTLDLHNNKIIYLLNDISKLKKLRTLDISNNNIIEVEDNGIYQLINLVSLNLSSNKINKVIEMPESLTLETIELDNNNLPELFNIKQ